MYEITEDQQQLKWRDKEVLDTCQCEQFRGNTARKWAEDLEMEEDEEIGLSAVGKVAHETPPEEDEVSVEMLKAG